MDLAALAAALNQRFGTRGGDYGWKAQATGDELSVEGPGPWSAHSYTASDLVAMNGGVADVPAITELVLNQAWSSHCQFLAMMFGEQRTGCTPAA